MVMRTASELSTKIVADTSNTEAPRSEIWLRGRRTGAVVPGAVLEGAVRCGKWYLLFLTNDVPFEDALGIHLLDDRLNLLDSARLGAPYSTGSFSALELRPPNSVRFRFIGDTWWSVEVMSRPRFRVPLLADAPGVTHRWGFSRYFVVRGKPRPQET